MGVGKFNKVISVGLLALSFSPSSYAVGEYLKLLPPDLLTHILNGFDYGHLRKLLSSPAPVSIPASGPNCDETSVDTYLRSKIRNVALQKAPPIFPLEDREYEIRDPEPDPAKKVRPFILGESGPRLITHSEAADYCKQKGQRLPTKDELYALKRATTSQNGEHDRKAISELYYDLLWSSSRGTDPYATDDDFLAFDGSTGRIRREDRKLHGNVRCVRSGLDW